MFYIKKNGNPKLFSRIDVSIPGDQDLYDGIQNINKKKYPEAFKCFERGSRYENEYAALFEAIFYFTGFGLGNRNPAKSIDLLRRVASTWSNPVAQYLIGCMFIEGDVGVPINSKSGIYWFTLAANNGWLDSVQDLGVAYYVIKDFKKAVSYFEQVANQDNSSNVEPVCDGPLYLFGNKKFELNMTNVSEDIKAMLKANVEEGMVTPVKCINYFNVFRQLYPIDDLVYVTVWNMLTSKKSVVVPACQLKLAAIYYDGAIGVDKDLEKSKYWARKAIKNGSRFARERFSFYFQ